MFIFFHLFFFFFFFFFNDTATTEIYTLSLHDALPISPLTRRKKTQSIYRLATTPGSARQPLWFWSSFGCRPFPPGPSKFRREPRTRRVLRSVISRRCRPCPLLFPSARGSTANLRQRGFPRASPAPIAGH